MRIARTQLLAAVAVLAVAAAACGGSDDDTATTVPPDETTTTAAPAATSAPDTTAPASEEAPDLAGTEWSLATYRLPGDGAITNLWPGSEITAKFDEAGLVTGSTGCNEYSAEFATSGPYDPFEDGIRDENDGQAVTITITAITERACEEQNFMEQEGEFLENLTGVDHWFIARGNLLLRGEEAYLEFDPAG